MPCIDERADTCPPPRKRGSGGAREGAGALPGRRIAKGQRLWDKDARQEVRVTSVGRDTATIAPGGTVPRSTLAKTQRFRATRGLQTLDRRALQSHFGKVADNARTLPGQVRCGLCNRDAKYFPVVTAGRRPRRGEGRCQEHFNDLSPAQRKRYQARVDGGVGGWTPAHVVEAVARHLANDARLDHYGSTFLDIGSSVGNVLGGVAAVCPRLGRAIGVEIARDVAEASSELLCGAGGWKTKCGCRTRFGVLAADIGDAVDSGQLSCVTHAFSYQQGQSPEMDRGILRVVAQLPKLRVIVLNWSRSTGQDLKAVFDPELGVVVSKGGTQGGGGTRKTGQFLSWRVTPELRAAAAARLGG